MFPLLNFFLLKSSHPNATHIVAEAYRGFILQKVSGRLEWAAVRETYAYFLTFGLFAWSRRLYADRIEGIWWLGRGYAGVWAYSFFWHFFFIIINRFRAYYFKIMRYPRKCLISLSYKIPNHQKVGSRNVIVASLSHFIIFFDKFVKARLTINKFSQTNLRMNI